MINISCHENHSFVHMMLYNFLIGDLNQNVRHQIRNHQKDWCFERPDMSPRKSCVPNLMSTRGLRLTRATMRHLRQV